MPWSKPNYLRLLSIAEICFSNSEDLASILALPVVGVLRRFRWVAILTVIAGCQWRQIPAVRLGSPIQRRACKQLRHLPPELAG